MVTHHLLHRSGRAAFPHPIPTSGDNAKASQRIGVTDADWRQPAADQPPHPVPEDPALLAAPRQGAKPKPTHLKPKHGQRRAVHVTPSIARANAEIAHQAAARHAEEHARYEARRAERHAKEHQPGKKARGTPPKLPEPGPRDKDQVNLTDEASRIMPTSGGGFAQCDNAQASVDVDTMLIVGRQVRH